MGDRDLEREGRLSGLSAALRTARIEEAERSQVVGDLRDAEMARLDLLREMLEPVLAQVPPDVDLFDTGMVPGEHPRLFIDMIAFVEMGRDRRTYRFLQDRRDGRVVLAESDSVGLMLSALTAYIARRLIEREKMLAGLTAGLSNSVAAHDADAASASVADKATPRKTGAGVAWALRLLSDGLGLVALGGLVWLGVHYAQGRVPNW